MNDLNAADRKAVKDRERAERDAARRATDDLIEVLNLPAGRRFIWSLLGECRVFGEVYDPSGQKMAYNAGVRSVGVKLLAQCMEADAAATLQMQLESAEPETRAAVTLALRTRLTGS